MRRPEFLRGMTGTVAGCLQQVLSFIVQGKGLMSQEASHLCRTAIICTPVAIHCWKTS